MILWIAKVIGEAVERIASWLAFLSGLGILFVMLAITCSVILRYVFDMSLAWPVEISEYLVVACVFLPLAFVLVRERNIHVDLFIMHLSKKKKVVLDLIISFLSFILFSLIVWQSGATALESLQEGVRSTTANEMPVFPSQVMVPLGGLLLCMALVVRIGRYSCLLVAEAINNEDTRSSLEQNDKAP